MIGPSYMDEIDCGNFFDDLLDFPADDLDAGVISGGGTAGEGFQNIWSAPVDEFPVTGDPVFSGSGSNSASDLSAELSVPYEDIVQLEWLSNFVEDSFSFRNIILEKEDECFNKDSSPHQFQTSSPVSVLESSSSCSGGSKPMLSPETVVPGRARSKRPRPASFNPRPAIQLISPTSSFTETPYPLMAPRFPSESESFAESRPLKKIPKPMGEPKKKKKMKLSGPVGPTERMEADQNPPPQGVRKCLHCEITKTPQWRAGPMGPKTLCNACGVRYKSGRLFPEYRPAASPTFVPSLHSNSHKKVVEMRSKFGDNVGMETEMETAPEFVLNTGFSALDYV